MSTHSSSLLSDASELKQSYLTNLPGVIYHMDSNRAICIYSDTLELTGYFPSDFKGGSLEWNDIIHPQDRKKIIQAPKYCGSPSIQTQMEYRIVKKEGTLNWVQDIRNSLFDESGRFSHADGIILNYNHHIAVRSALRSSEETLRKTFEASPDAITVTDLEGNILNCNQAALRLHGIANKDDIIGVNALSFVHRKDHPRAINNIQKLLLEGHLQNIPYTFLRNDGSIISTELSTSVVRDENGNPCSFISITHDITNRVEAEKQKKKMREADRMITLGTLISGVAHEINNPNNFILLNAPILKKFHEGTLPYLEALFQKQGDFPIGKMRYSKLKSSIPQIINSVIEGARRIKIIVEDLKNYARQNNSNNFKPVDIIRVVESSILLTKHLIEKSTHSFKTDIPSSLPLLHGNTQQVSQVLINLLQNACQAITDPSQTIAVSAQWRQDKNQLHVIVEDEGQGIPQETLKHITDPFFTTKNDKDGIGLGLSISAKIMREHGGKLIFSSAINKGTQATMVFPIQPSERM